MLLYEHDEVGEPSRLVLVDEPLAHVQILLEDRSQGGHRTEVIEPDSLDCPCGCGEMHRIGADRTERLDILPAQIRVIFTVRPRYACRACAKGVTQAPAPAHLIGGGLPTEGAIAHVLVNKFSDHLPLYRQSQILARSGIDLHRSTLAEWVGTAAFHLGPGVDQLAQHLKGSGKLFMDETTAPVLDPGRGRTKTGYLWALARHDRGWGGDHPPGVVFTYAPGRAGQNAEQILQGRIAELYRIEGESAAWVPASSCRPGKPAPRRWSPHSENG